MPLVCCLWREQMIAATAVCGMVYAAFAGQPLTIIGSTGPVLAFIAVLYKTSVRMVRGPNEETLTLTSALSERVQSVVQFKTYRCSAGSINSVRSRRAFRDEPNANACRQKRYNTLTAAPSKIWIGCGCKCREWSPLKSTGVLKTVPPSLLIVALLWRFCGEMA